MYEIFTFSNKSQNNVFSCHDGSLKDAEELLRQVSESDIAKSAGYWD